MLNRLQGVFKSFQVNDVRCMVVGGIAGALDQVKADGREADLSDMCLLELDEQEG
jgi:hypothetical protein